MERSERWNNVRLWEKSINANDDRDKLPPHMGWEGDSCEREKCTKNKFMIVGVRLIAQSHYKRS